MNIGMKILAGGLVWGALTLPALAGPPPFSTNPADVKAGTYMLDPNHGKITWSLNHLGFSTYTGQFGHVTATMMLDPAKIGSSSLTAMIEISSIGTLNPTLDGELKGAKFFNAQAYPDAVFKSTSIVRTGTKTASVKGEFTMLGVTKPIVLLVTFNQAGINPMSRDYEVGFEAHASIVRSQFGLSAFVPYVGDDVTLDIEGEFHKK